MNHYDNGQTVLNDWTAVRVTVGKGYVYGMKIRHIPPGLGLKIHHHVVLNPICHRTTKEKNVASDCRGTDNQTWIALQYNLVDIFFDECFNGFFNICSKCTCTCM